MGNSKTNGKAEPARTSSSNGNSQDPEKLEPLRSIAPPMHKDIDLQSYRKGYPRYCLTIGETPEFQIFRRFRRARVRLLLAKQDRVAQIEQELDEIDRNEKAELFLGTMRRDKNSDRAALLKALDEALADYDQLVQRSDWAINAKYPRPDSLKVARDWRSEEGSIARKESAYLDCHRWELLNIGDREHLTYSRLERQIEQFLGFCVSSVNNMTARFRGKEPRATIIYRPFVREVTRVLIAVLAILLLLSPIIGLNAVKRTLPRFIIIFASSSTFIMSISVLSTASIGEVFAAGAAYAAVMVVFVSGNGV